ncbi:MAG TPA: hypothetical protein VND45_04925, partial [Thermoanaerobaculia bacterium]|nr:hypothetical protein [Thermoanaerobaculia bacterium]
MITHAGRRVSDAEVCFFRADGLRDPIEQYLASARSRCLPADDIIDLPAGDWNVYARHASGLTSTHQTVMHYGGAPIPEQLYKSIEIELQPSGTIDFTPLLHLLAQEEHVFVYFPKAATGRPLVEGESTAAVPAGEPVVWMVAPLRGKPRLIGALITVERRQTIAAAKPSTRETDLLTWVRVARPPQERRPARLPAIRYVTAAGRSYDPVAPVPEHAASAFVLFRDMPHGSGTLRVDGEMWERDELAVVIGSDSPVVTGRGLRIAAAARLRIEWSVAGQPQSEIAATLCAGARSQTKDAAVTILRCDGAEATSAEACREVARHTITPSVARGETTSAALSAGTYVVALAAPGFPVVRETVDARSGETTRVALRIDPVVVRGIVRLGGKPLQARIAFASGTGYSSDADGHFTALLARDPGVSAVRVFSCDDELLYVDLPRKPLAERALYEIAIPDNRVTVNVADDRTGAPVGDAEVVFRVATPQDADTVAYSGTPLRTSAEGVALFSRLPVNELVNICARKTGYGAACVDARLKPEESSRNVAVRLPREESRAGRVVAGGKIENGLLFWTAADGTVTETSRVAPDGTFTYSRPHSEAEHLVLVSANLPLVLGVPSYAGESLVVSLPRAASRDLRVSITGRNERDGFVELAIGGRRIPEEAFSRHQSWRGKQA